MILVLGATGRVGGEVLRLLAAAGAPVRALSRDPARAAGVPPPPSQGPVEWQRGDLDDPAALGAALAGVDQAFLMSPVGERMAEQQIAVVDAACLAGVTRVVKLSGSAWTYAPTPTVSGAAHARVEAALAASGLAYVLVRPNAFVQTSLARLPVELSRGDSFTLAWGDGAVPLIDVRDIAAVAAHALLHRDVSGTFAISGPCDLTGNDIATAAGIIAGRSIAYQPLAIEAAVAGARARGESPFMLTHVREVFERIQAGAAAGPTDETPRLLGHAARPIEDWLRDMLVNYGT
jgi:uncharacterized protein YbjT (DUF2867 family)